MQFIWGMLTIEIEMLLKYTSGGSEWLYSVANVYSSSKRPSLNTNMIWNWFNEIKRHSVGIFRSNVENKMFETKQIQCVCIISNRKCQDYVYIKWEKYYVEHKAQLDQIMLDAETWI